MEVDASTLNKLRFALPTLEIVRAFDPSANCLKKYPYRDMKKKMSWAFTRGLVLSPSAFSKQIRGSSHSHDIVARAVAPLKSEFISREAADRIISNIEKPASRSSSVAMESAGEAARDLSLDDRFKAHEEKMMGRINETINSLFSRLQSNLPAFNHEESSHSETEESDFPERDVSSPPDSWEAPPLFDCTEEITVSPDLPFSFAPCVKEREPDVPLPSPEAEAHGHSSQKLDSVGWSRIRYMEAQKETQTGGIFARLQPNPELDVPHNSLVDLLACNDGAFGILCHGLILQRLTLADTINMVVSKHPSVKSDLISALSSKESMFKKTSDNLLQYVCGKRAEAIASRRKLLEPAIRVPPRILKDISPSQEYLFDPKSLAEAMGAQSSSVALAPPRLRLQRPQTTKKYNPRAHTLPSSSSSARKRPMNVKESHPSKKKRLSDAPRSKGHLRGNGKDYGRRRL
ncbi:hypothetical protein M8J76_015353 [Diaphorina citri]|nr:hypothetical protein M8J75_016500 [Diaphorina citri]KAI5727174.1 hypothetical protein M8J76_015353 [Diaphorina citri]